MTYQLGLSLPHRFAAIAPVEGGLLRGHTPPVGLGGSWERAGSLAVLDVHGLWDETIPTHGNLSSDGWYYTALSEAPRQLPGGELTVMGRYADYNGCPPLRGRRPSRWEGLEVALARLPVAQKDKLACVDWGAACHLAAAADGGGDGGDDGRLASSSSPSVATPAYTAQQIGMVTCTWDGGHWLPTWAADIAVDFFLQHPKTWPPDSEGL